MFDVGKFQKLRRGNFGLSLHFYQEIDSTNTAATEFARKNAPEGTIILADSQSQGRGRNTHSWYSPAGVNLYFTVLLYPPAERLHYLPFLIGLSLAETLEAWGLRCDLKWPNDVLVNEQKICGILIQTSMEENRLQFALAGVGVNLNAKEFPAELRSSATSVARVTGVDVDREQFLASLLFNLERYYSRIQEMSWQELERSVQNKSSFLDGCDVQIEQGGKTITGKTAGLDRMGGLIVQTAFGEQVFYAAEVRACRKR